MRILAIIVTYNRLDLLKECIIALSNQSYKNFDFLVIDNASTDGTLSYLKESNVPFVHMDHNAGGAGGFSRGLKEGVERGYDYVWAMDDDTIPDEDCLLNLVDSIEKLNSDFGFVCSYVKWINDEPCVMNIPSPASLSSAKTVFFAKTGVLSCKSASFVSILFPARIIKKYGLPIKEFFIWGDDIEYTKRISRYENCFCNYNSSVVHKMKNNNPTDIVSDIPERLNRYKFSFRNRCFIARQDGFKGIISNNLSVVYQIIKIIRYKNKKKLLKIFIVLSGWFKGQFFRPRIEYVD